MKYFICLVMTCLCASVLYATDVYMAPLIIDTSDQDVPLSSEDNRINDVLLHMVNEKNKSKELHFFNLGENRTGGKNLIRSSLDASEVCEMYGIHYLVYGFFRKTHAYYEMEIRLYERDSRGIVKTLYAKAEIADHAEMIGNLADRFVRYLYTALGVAPQKIEAEEKIMEHELGGMMAGAEIGYWTPAGDWFGVYTGIIKVGFSFLVHPEEIVWYWNDYPVGFRFGLMADYMLGISKPNMVFSVLHSIQLQMPVQLLVYFRKQHCAYAGVQITYIHDIVYQQRLFGSPVVGNSGTLGGGVSVGYEYWINSQRDLSFGAELVFDADFFNTPRFNVSLMLQCKYRFPFYEKESAEYRNNYNRHQDGKEMAVPDDEEKKALNREGA